MARWAECIKQLFSAIERSVVRCRISELDANSRSRAALFVMGVLLRSGVVRGAW